MMKEDDRPFRGLSVPEPPEDLRRQALSRAREALRSAPSRDLWERIWESRRARLAWSTAVLALAVCHLVVPGRDAGPPREPSPAARTGSYGQEELAGIADLPRLSLDARPIAASTGAPVEIETDPSEENPS